MAQGLCGTKGLCKHIFFFFFFLAMPDLSCRIWALSCGIQDFIPWPGIRPESAAWGVDQQESPWLRVFSTDKCFWNNPFNLKLCAWNTPPFVWEIMVKSITMPFPELSCCHRFTVHLCINVRNSCPGSAQVWGALPCRGCQALPSNEVLWNFPLNCWSPQAPLGRPGPQISSCDRLSRCLGSWISW